MRIPSSRTKAYSVCHQLKTFRTRASNDRAQLRISHWAHHWGHNQCFQSQSRRNQTGRSNQEHTRSGTTPMIWIPNSSPLPLQWNHGHAQKTTFGVRLNVRSLTFDVGVWCWCIGCVWCAWCLMCLVFDVWCLLTVKFDVCGLMFDVCCWKA